MKLLFHEKILGLITVLIVAYFLVFSFTYHPEMNIAYPAETSASPYLVNINTADSDELQTLNGIGPKTALKIIEYREKHGNFQSTDELCEVSGIGNSTLDKIKEYIKI